MLSGTSMACAHHVKGFVTAISCVGNKIANSKLNATSLLRKQQFLVNLNMSTNCTKKAPKTSVVLLTFLDEDECDVVWREEMDSD